MQNATPTLQTLAADIAASGIRLEVLAVATDKSYSAVYRYLTGSRTPSDEWIAQASAALAAWKLGRAA